MLHVVEQACNFAEDFASGTVVLESDEQKEFPIAIEELQSTEARNKATGYAATRGCPDPRINGNIPSAYPINNEGYPLDLVRDDQGQALPPNHPRMQIARYRIEIPVCRKLV